MQIAKAFFHRPAKALIGLVSGFGLLALTAMSAEACGTCLPPPAPKPPSGGGCGYGGCGGTVIVPPTNVTVITPPVVVVSGSNSITVNNSAVVNANATATGSAFGSGGAGAVYFGGGGSWSQGPTGISMVPNFAVEGSGERSSEFVSDYEKRTVVRRRAIQAVCLDDKAVPHPASQVQPGRDVPESYVGEIYRCMAGTRLQATFVDYDSGDVRFDGGRTLDCVKGDALYRDDKGVVSCRKQLAARDCNERSLLRRYGPGIKVVMTRFEESFARTREVRRDTSKERSSHQMGTLILDGGVGGMVH